MACVKCGKPLTPNEMGLSKKLLGRATAQGYCLRCLAEKFDVSEELLREKTEQFKRAGCTLFT